MGWITTKSGKRINTDWFDEDEKNKQRQINANKSEGDKKNNKPVTEEDIKKKLIKESYTDDPEYQKLSNEIHDLFDRRQNAKKKYRELKEELSKEQSVKPKSEWTTEDEIADLLGERPVKYTEKGQKLKEEYDKAWNEYNEADHEWTEKSSKLKSIDESQHSKQKEEWAKADKEFSTDLKNEYPGFKVNESTTPYIDQLLKDGKAQIVEMSPQMYLHEIAHNIFDRGTLETSLRGTDVKNINKYMQMMKDGTKFDTPYLNYRDKEQEGRHRAIAAMMLGVERIPVIIIRNRR